MDHDSKIKACKLEIDKLKNNIDAMRSRLQHSTEDAMMAARRSLPTALDDLQSQPKLRRTLEGHFGKVYSMHWAGDSTHLVSASQDGKLIVWNAITNNKVHSIPLRSSWVMTCAFEETTSDMVACGGLDNLCSIYKLNNQGQPVISASRELSGHDGYVSCCRFVGRDHILTSSGDSTCKFWDVERGEAILSFSDHAGDVMSVAVSPNPSSTGGERGGTDSFASTQPPKPPSTTEEAALTSREAAKSPLGDAKEGGDGEMAEEPETTPSAPSGTGGAGAGQNLFVSGSCDTTAKVWDIRSGKCTHTFHGHDSDINSVCFFPDGRAVGTGSDDASCRLFDLRSYGAVNTFHSPRILCGITSVAFSRSGRILFAGYDDYACYGWDTTAPSSDGPVFEFNSMNHGHENRVSCLGVTPNGQALCTGSWDTLLKIWS